MSDILRDFPTVSYRKRLETDRTMIATTIFTHDTNNKNPQLVDSTNSILVKKSSSSAEETNSSSSSSSNNYELEGCPSYAMCANEAGEIIVVDLREDPETSKTFILRETEGIDWDLYILEISYDDKYVVGAGNSNTLYKFHLDFDYDQQDENKNFKLNVKKSPQRTIKNIFNGSGDIYGLNFRSVEFLLAQNSAARKYIVAVCGAAKVGDKKLCLVDVEAEEKICHINTTPMTPKESSAAGSSNTSDATFCCWNYSGELLGCCLDNGTMIICEVNETPKYKISSDDSETTATSSTPLSKYFDIQTHFIDKVVAPGSNLLSTNYSWSCQFSSSGSFIGCAGELVRVYIKNNDFNSCVDCNSETGFDSFFIRSFDIDLSAQGLYGEIQCSSETTASYPKTIYGFSMLNRDTFVAYSESEMMHIVDLSLCEREKHKLLQKKQQNEKLTKAEEVFEINCVVAATNNTQTISGFRTQSCKNFFALSSFEGELFVYKNFTVSWKWNAVKNVFLVSDRSNTRIKIALEQWKTLRNIVSFF